LRYGENPHQKSTLFKIDFDEIFQVLHGKELSYNNLLDIDAGYNLINEFKNNKPTCVIFKHGNPCGAATSDDLHSAYVKAFKSDTISPFGGLIVFNKRIDFKTSIEVDKLFAELILAPGFDDDAIELLKKKKNRRLISFNFSNDSVEIRSVKGGVLLQDKDNKILDKKDLTVQTGSEINDALLEDIIFADKIVKSVKSNAIVFVKNLKTIGIGGGQPSRLDSTKIAILKANEFGHNLKNSLCASDAFFPFPDGVLEIIKVGAECIIQPGGSVKDEDIIRTAKENNVTMIFTGIRHFKH
jgi:phosphoribosylaminoimidazolecarboxamide formyltransferase/IMP cyclohydrolase